MTLFSPTATFKILILWAGAKRKNSALAIRNGLSQKVPAGYEVSVITEDHSDARYDALSQNAINAADCVLMIACNQDWRTHDSAIREREYFKALIRKKRKYHNQFRFVRILDEDIPEYEGAGLRPLFFYNPRDLANNEIETALKYFSLVKARMDKTVGKAAPDIELSTAMLSTPGGRLVATLWVATFDDELFQSAPVGTSQASSRSFVDGLRRLKALHSVHSGLGAMIEKPIAALRQNISHGMFDINKIRKQLVKELDFCRSPRNLALNDALTDCIDSGLLPTLSLLARRLCAVPDCTEGNLFIEAAMERLSAILDNRSELNPDAEDYDGDWWVFHYSCCRDLVQNRFQAIVSDVDISGLTSPCAEHQFGSTLNAAKFLLDATVQWTFSILVVFSFLHVHRQMEVKNLVPKNIESAVEELIADWRNNVLSDGVVRWSNEIILHLLAVAREEEEAIHATS